MSRNGSYPGGDPDDIELQAQDMPFIGGPIIDSTEQIQNVLPFLPRMKGTPDTGML